GTERLDGGIYLVVMPPNNQYFEIMVDDDQHFVVETDTADYVKNMKVQGSEQNQLFLGDIRFLADMRTKANEIQSKMKSAEEGSAAQKKLKGQLDQINEDVQSQRLKLVEDHPDMLYSKVIMAMKEPEIPEAPKGADGKPLDSLFAFNYYRAHFFDNLDFTDNRMLRTPVYHNKVMQYLDKLTYRHPDSLAKSMDYIVEETRGDSTMFQYTVVAFLNKYAKSKVMGFDALYVHMVENYYLTGDAWWVDEETLSKMEERALAISPTLIGRKAPNFLVRDVAGNTQSPWGIEADYTVLYFWDYDCSHCKKVTPVLADALGLYVDYPVKALTLNINGDRQEWIEKLGSYGLSDLPNGIHTHDAARSSGFDAMYDVRSTPRILLLDKDKKIMAKQITVAQLQEILDMKLGIDRPEEEKIEDSSPDSTLEE
ncbi:MAG: thioredoxin-like domain-containing protein, partial [Bacteroidota bacterium]